MAGVLTGTLPRCGSWSPGGNAAAAHAYFAIHVFCHINDLLAAIHDALMALLTAYLLADNMLSMLTG